MREHEDLKAFLDGELPEPRASEVRAAIERDPELAREAEALTQISNAFAQVPAATPVGLESTLLALKRAERRERLGWVMRMGFATAALAGVVGLGLMLRPRHETDEVVATAAKAPSYAAPVESAPAMEELAPMSKAAADAAPATVVRPKTTTDAAKRVKQPVTWTRKGRDAEANTRQSTPPKPSAPGRTADVPTGRDEGDKTHSGVAKTAPAPATVAPIPDEIVTLVVGGGLDAAQAEVHKLVSEFLPPTEGRTRSAAYGVTMAETDAASARRELVFDVPESLLPDLLSRLKSIPEQLAVKMADSSHQARGGGAAGLSGHGGGFGAGGLGGKAEASRKAAKPGEPKKRVRVVLTKSAPESAPASGGGTTAG